MTDDAGKAEERHEPPPPAPRPGALVPAAAPWTRYLADGEGFRCSRCRALLGVREGYNFRVKRGYYGLLIFGVVELVCKCGERFELNTTRWFDKSETAQVPLRGGG